MDNKKELEALNPNSNSSSTFKCDALTPHKISVVLLVQQYLKAKQTAIDNGLLYPSQARRKFCMLLLKLIQNPDMPYKDLHDFLKSKYKIDEAHLEGFEKCMSELSTLGIENLFDLFDMQNVMDKILSENSGVSQYGIVGLYIRKIVVTLDRMSFPEMMVLYKKIILYYEKGVRALAICPENYKNSSNSDNQRNNYKSTNIHSRWSQKQAELFVAQQCALLETNELKALEPIKMQNRVIEIIQDNPLFSQAHFLNYLNNLRLRDFFSSLDSLHRTFDRNPVQSLNPIETRGFQYSSLNLSILHANFNHKKEALACLKECVMLAQECSDRHCLELANSWLCIINEEHTKPNEKCIPEQADIILIQSVSLSIQFIVKVAALCGYKPSALFEILMKSDELNCKNSLQELLANSLAEYSALWTLYGKNELASLFSQLLLKLNKCWIYGDIGNTEGVCQVLCCLSLWLCLQGELAFCNVVLHHAKERFPRDPLAKNWMTCDAYIRTTLSIYKCKWQDAIGACSHLYIFDKNLSILQRASVYIAKRNTGMAKIILDQFLRDENLQPLIFIRALILLAYSHINSSNKFSEVIEILSKASTYSKIRFFELEAAIIDMMFAYILLEMKLPQKALEVIEVCMDVILANGGIYEQAKTIFLFSRCLVASTSVINEKVSRISQCLDMIAKAINYFKKLEAHCKVKDVYIFLASFYNDVDMINERNKYACKFKQYDQEFPTAYEYQNLFF